MSSALSIVILAAGKGSRMGENPLPKVLMPVGPLPMLYHIIQTAQDLNPESIYLVHAPSLSLPENLNIIPVCQEKPLGTGDALKQALPLIPDHHHVLVLYGDVPLIHANQLQPLLKEKALSLLNMTPENPDFYGRILRNEQHEIMGIVEHKDALENQRQIQEVWSGTLAAPAKQLKAVLQNITADNQQKEYYLTEIVQHWAGPIQGILTEQIDRLQGVNTLAELIQVERTYQSQLAQTLIQKGLHISDPDRFDCRGSLTFGKNCRIEPNVLITGEVILGDHVIIEAGCQLHQVIIEDHCHIKPYSVLSQSHMGTHTHVGPFAHIRPGTHCQAHNKVGAFVETKNTLMGPYSKASHLSYLGDATIGKQVNIGAGVITCNYDGHKKQTTQIEDEAFIGSGCQLIAPITVGTGAYIGAGTTLRRSAKAHALTVVKNQETVIEGWAKSDEK